MSTVEQSYIIDDNNTVDEQADKVVIEAMVIKVRFQHSLGRGVNRSLDWTGMVGIHVSTSIYSLVFLYFNIKEDFIFKILIIPTILLKC